MIVVNIREDEEFIKLGQALKKASVVGSGVDAKMVILDGLVEVNGQVELQRGKKLHDGDVVAGFIFLTDSGRQIAEMIFERHELISNWLMRIGVSKDTALEDACKIEHVLSPETFEAIKKFIDKE